MKSYIQKIKSATIHNKETGEKIMDLPVTDMCAVPASVCFDTKFPTWVIAYCPDSSSFYVTNERCWFWQLYGKEFISEEDGIKYFEEHIDFFIGTENLIMNGIVYNYKETDRVFLENTNRWYKNVKNGAV